MELTAYILLRRRRRPPSRLTWFYLGVTCLASLALLGTVLMLPDCIETDGVATFSDLIGLAVNGWATVICWQHLQTSWRRDQDG